MKTNLIILILLFLGALALRVFYVSDYLSPPDMTEYMIMAKSFDSNNYDITISGQKIRPIYTPGFPLLIWLSAKFFGFSDRLPGLISALLGSLCIIVIYLLGREMLNDMVGLISALFLTFNPLHWRYSIVGMSDVSAGFFLLLTVWFFWTGFKRNDVRYAIGSGCTLGFLCIVHPADIIIYLSFCIWTIFTLKRSYKTFLSLSLVIGILIFAYYSWEHYGLGKSIEQLLNQASIYRALSLKNAFSSSLSIGMNTGWGNIFTYGYFLLFGDGRPWINLSHFPFIIVFTFIGISRMIKKDNFLEIIFLLIWLFLYFIIRSLYEYTEPRYMLPLMYPFIIMIAASIEYIYKNNKLSKKIVIAGAFLILFIPVIMSYKNIIDVKRYGMESIDLARSLKEIIPQNSIVITANYFFVEYYLERRSLSVLEYHSIAINESVNEMIGNKIKDGYEIFLVKDDVMQRVGDKIYKHILRKYKWSLIARIGQIDVWKMVKPSP